MTASPSTSGPSGEADHWVEAHADALFRYALTRLRRREDAEDAVQEALLAALNAARPFRGDSAERTWLIGILRHKIIDRIRIAARQEAHETQVGDDLEAWCGDSGHWRHAPKPWAADPAQLSEDAEFWQRVRACFAALPERQAQVFALRTFDGLAAEDICKRLDITPTNLWVLLHRARTRLRACLESSWFAPEHTP